MPHHRTLWMAFAAAFTLAHGCPAQGDATLLKGGRVHVRPGSVLASADVLVEQGLIKAVGNGLSVPEGATVIDLSGHDLYPGFIDPLNEAFLETGHAARGAFGSGDPAIDAFDPFLAPHNRSMLRAGVLTVGVGPLPAGIRGGVVSVVAVAKDAGAPDVIAKDQVVPCEITALERVPRPGAATQVGRFGFPEASAFPTTTVMMREGAAKAIDELLEGAKRYREAWEKYEKDAAEYQKKLAEWEKTKGTESKPASRPAAEPERRPPPEPRPDGGRPDGGRPGGFRRRGPPVTAPPPESSETASAPSASGKPRAPEKPKIEPGKEALGRVLKREAPIWIVAHWASDIDAALEIARNRKIRIVLAGASEAMRRVDAIKEARAVVALGNPFASDPDSLDRLLHAEDLGARLAKKGVPVTFFTAGDPATGPAGLPFVAALAIGLGLSEDHALGAVTENAARALGLEKKLGTIETGKVASLFACRGSPFAPDARATHVWVRGRPLEMEKD